MRINLRRAGVAGLGMALWIAWGASAVCGMPLRPGQRQSYSAPEYNAYRAAHDEKDPQAKIKLLDEFAAKYPESTFAPDTYRDYYLAYFAIKNYRQSLAYADRVLALGEKIDFDRHLEALAARAEAYAAGCGDSALQGPAAAAKAKGAAMEGLQALGEWHKPEELSDQEFAAQMANLGKLFNGAAAIAESGGNADSCKAASDPGALDRMLDQIGAEDRQGPRVK